MPKVPKLRVLKGFANPRYLVVTEDQIVSADEVSDDFVALLMQKSCRIIDLLEMCELSVFESSIVSTSLAHAETPSFF